MTLVLPFHEQQRGPLYPRILSKSPDIHSDWSIVGYTSILELITRGGWNVLIGLVELEPLKSPIRNLRLLGRRKGKKEWMLGYQQLCTVPSFLKELEGKQLGA